MRIWVIVGSNRSSRLGESEERQVSHRLPVIQMEGAVDVTSTNGM
jgi:hypothetical protein